MGRGRGNCFSPNVWVEVEGFQLGERLFTRSLSIPRFCLNSATCRVKSSVFLLEGLTNRISLSSVLWVVHLTLAFQSPILARASSSTECGLGLTLSSVKRAKCRRESSCGMSALLFCLSAKKSTQMQVLHSLFLTARLSWRYQSPKSELTSALQM